MPGVSKKEWARCPQFGIRGGGGGEASDLDPEGVPRTVFCVPCQLNL